jgi:hypothetical protein
LLPSEIGYSKKIRGIENGFLMTPMAMKSQHRIGWRGPEIESGIASESFLNHGHR